MKRKFVWLSVALSVPRQQTPSSSRRIKIYVLVDPRDAGIRYVGKTSHTLTARLEWHLRAPTNRAMAWWFEDLRRLGERPHIQVLEFVDQAEWEDAERGWIHWFRQRGQLLNVDPGGNHRDWTGRERGRFVGKYVAPTEAEQPRQKSVGLWERVHRPMLGFAGQRPRKSAGGSARGQRRYITGDPPM